MLLVLVVVCHMMAKQKSFVFVRSVRAMTVVPRHINIINMLIRRWQNILKTKYASTHLSRVSQWKLSKTKKTNGKHELFDTKRNNLFRNSIAGAKELLYYGSKHETYRNKDNSAYLLKLFRECTHHFRFGKVDLVLLIQKCKQI